MWHFAVDASTAQAMLYARICSRISWLPYVVCGRTIVLIAGIKFQARFVTIYHRVAGGATDTGSVHGTVDHPSA